MAALVSTSDLTNSTENDCPISGRLVRQHRARSARQVAAQRPASPTNALRSEQTRLLLLAAAVLLCTAVGCEAAVPPSDEPVQGTEPDQANRAKRPSIEVQVRRFCGDCHLVPRPDSFPKDHWRHEVRRGFDFYLASGRTDLDVPIVADVVRYYRQRAPETLDWESVSSATADSLFQRVEHAEAANWSPNDPAISFVSKVTSESPAGARWWVSDMQRGEIALLDRHGQRVWSAEGVAANPVAIRQHDLNIDGQPDLIVADLASFLPEDHDRGAVVYWPDWKNTEPSSAVRLLQQVGRVADVQVADIDDDRDVDVIVGEFGWHQTGGVHLLRNTGALKNGIPVFDHAQLDDRAGCIHVLVTDLNRDGRPDIIALLAQEYEQVVAYINRTDAFERVTLYAAPGPSYGSSGISLVDFDQDGDQDLLYTNGDTFDSFLVKPYHSVRWLENVFSEDSIDDRHAVPEFTPHLIGQLPGVHRALAGDLDQDGDLDVAAVALIPDQTLDEIDRPMEAVVWFEQQPDGTFTRHVVASGRPAHTALVLDDVDRDGDIDLVAGNFSAAGGPAAVTVFQNQIR